MTKHTSAQISQEYLKSKLNYDPETGIFTRIKASGITPNNSKCGTLSRGYVQISIGSHLYFAHRLAFLYMTGKLPEKFVDHINGIRSDNRFCNIREANCSQNQQNKGRQSNNTSGFKGVSYYKNNGKWRSAIKVNGKKRHLGFFNTPEEAHEEYCKAAKDLHGEFANTGAHHE
jgi:hypothetical protein